MPNFLQIWAVSHCECLLGSFLCLLKWRIVGGHSDQVKTDPKRDLLPIDLTSTE